MHRLIDVSFLTPARLWTPKHRQQYKKMAQSEIQAAAPSPTTQTSSSAPAPASAAPPPSAGVILDSDQIPLGVSASFVRLPGEEVAEYHARVTHLHHQRQNIRQIGDLSTVRNLTVLYLYDNRLTRIERLDPVSGLQLLYLQRNAITTVENLGHLTRLRKLYLSRNRIKVVEGLEKLTSLQELHVDNQDLPPSASLVFDPRSCKKLQQLQVLNTSGNRMRTLRPIDEMRQLRQLDAGNNSLEDVREAAVALGRMASLRQLELRGNPLSQKRDKTGKRHWEVLAGSCPGLTELDGRAVTPACRAMMAAMSNGRRSNKGSSL